MTKIQVPKVVNEIAGQLPGFVSEGRLMFMMPLGHSLKGVYFDRSIVGPEMCNVNVFVQPLFVRAENLTFNLGWRLGGGTKLWNLDASLAELMDKVKLEAVPFLASVISPRDLAKAAKRLHITENPLVKIYIAYALVRDGEFTDAIDALDEFVAVEPHGFWRNDALSLKRRLHQDPIAAQSQLDANEIYTVAALKLDAFV